MSESDVAEITRSLERVEKKIDDVQKSLGGITERSAKHSVRIKQIEDNVSLAHTRISGVKRYLVSGLIAVASMAVSYAWNLVQAAAQK